MKPDVGQSSNPAVIHSDLFMEVDKSQKGEDASSEDLWMGLQKPASLKAGHPRGYTYVL